MRLMSTGESWSIRYCSVLVHDDASEWKVIVSIVGSCISNARCSALPHPGDRRPARRGVARTSRVVGDMIDAKLSNFANDFAAHDGSNRPSLV